MSHFYRGEMGRIMVWRQRLDVTTNWAITSTTAIITIAFSTREVPHIIFFFNLAIVWVLLWIEARHYRFLIVLSCPAHRPHPVLAGGADFRRHVCQCDCHHDLCKQKILWRNLRV